MPRLEPFTAHLSQICPLHTGHSNSTSTVNDTLSISLPLSLFPIETRHYQLSKHAKEVQRIVSRPLIKRKIVGYNKDFLNSYRPNKTAYLTDAERAHLRELGTVPIGNQPAGTYARQIIDRLLVDLSWNSSRLEGNTYTLLDTKPLLEFGKQAEGSDRIEALQFCPLQSIIHTASSYFPRSMSRQCQAAKLSFC